MASSAAEDRATVDDLRVSRKDRGIQGENSHISFPPAPFDPRLPLPRFPSDFDGLARLLSPRLPRLEGRHDPQ